MTADELEALEAVAGPGVREEPDPTRRLIILPALKLPAGAKPEVAFAIYQASASPNGYMTRLFFEQPICGANGVTPQTTPELLCGRTMYAASYNGVPADLPLHQGVLAHLRLYEAAP